LRQIAYVAEPIRDDNQTSRSGIIAGVSIAQRGLTLCEIANRLRSLVMGFVRWLQHEKILSLKIA